MTDQNDQNSVGNQVMSISEKLDETTADYWMGDTREFAPRTSLPPVDVDWMEIQPSNEDIRDMLVTEGVLDEIPENKRPYNVDYER